MTNGAIHISIGRLNRVKIIIFFVRDAILISNIIVRNDQYKI